jgi:hypothetical protein
LAASGSPAISSMHTSQLNAKLQRAPTETLVVHCGDYRFQAGFSEFLNRVLGLSENYDRMVIPGGPLSLTHQLSHGEDTRAVRKWTRFFVEKHGIKRVVLVQHQDCGWYQSMSAKLRDPAALRRRQEQDLGRAADVLKESFPDLRVDLFYAGWDADERITVESISA